MATRKAMAVASLLIGSAATSALAQTQEYESALGLLTGSRQTTWTVHVDAYLNPYMADRWVTRNNANGFSLDQAIVVYPLLEGAANAVTLNNFTRGALYEDDSVINDAPELLDGYYLGARYLIFNAEDINAFYMRLSIDTRVVTWALAFDEASAMEINWPEGPWPPVAQSALAPQMFINPQDEAVRALVRRWAGPNPNSLRPAALAKRLAAGVIDEFQPNGLGYEFNSNGFYGGLQIAGAGAAARTMLGSPFDQATLLCGVYRAAGLPARVVIGYDIGASADGLDVDDLNDRESCQPVQRGTVPINPVLRSWVEFYLYDEARGLGEWIPVDIERQRGVSSRSRPLGQAWEFFGNMPCSDLLIPIAYHFHPPEAVVSPGPPAMWGWLAFPATPRLEQQFNIFAMEAPRTAVDMP